MNIIEQAVLQYVIFILSLVVGILSIIYYGKYQKQLINGALEGPVAGSFKNKFNLYGALYVVAAFLVILESYARMSEIVIIIMVIVIGGGIYNLMLINKKEMFDLSDIKLLRWNAIILLTIALVYILTILNI